MKKVFLVSSQIFLLGILAILLFGGMYGSTVIAALGTPNATVQTLLDIGNVYPEITSIDCNAGGGNLTLTANATKLLVCNVSITDWNNWSDIDNVEASFFDDTDVDDVGSDDGGHRYTNSSCSFTNTSTYTVDANCTFEVQYYANPTNWNFTVTVNDSVGWNDTNSTTVGVNELLALGVPDSINYGTVNATKVSLENVSNVTNLGNVQINISLEGYSHNDPVVGAGNAMNCSLGAVKNISIEYEKYNLTASNNSDLTLAEFDSIYTNLTSAPAQVKQFGLDYKQNDSNTAVKSTYWRIYVPVGVAGTCEGDIVFGATTGVES